MEPMQPSPPSQVSPPSTLLESLEEVPVKPHPARLQASDKRLQQTRPSLHRHLEATMSKFSATAAPAPYKGPPVAVIGAGG